MKRIICCILTAIMICAAFSGCVGSDNSKTLTASKVLDNLFTTVDLMDATIDDLQAKMEAGSVTSKRLTQMYIDRINVYDKKQKLNSIISINPNALKEAQKLDNERKKGKVRGSLHGIPIVVKANYDIKGMATSAGSNALADMKAAEDSFVVKKLKKAGAVILAQTNMSEFASSAVSSKSTLGGNVHNAYDTSRVSGGSSGGSAVAVTCNFAAAGIGTDTGGSIRNPSSLSNLYAIRPSKGLTSVSGIFPLQTYKDTAAPTARTAKDMALMLEAMAGTDSDDDYTVEADADALLGKGYTDSLSDKALKGMRIGYLADSFSYSSSNSDEIVYDNPDDKVKGILTKAIADFKKAGAELVDMSEILTTKKIKEISSDIGTDTFEYDADRFLNEKGSAAKYKTLKDIYNSGANGVMHMNLKMLINDPNNLADSFENTYNPYSNKVGPYQRIPNWQKVLRGRDYISKLFKNHNIDAVMYLNNFDIAGEETDLFNNNKHNKAEYDMIFGSLLGLPDVTVPMGFSDTDRNCKSELPLGISLFSDYGNEKALMNIAYSYQRQAGDNIRRTPEITPALEDENLNAFLEGMIDLAYSMDSQYSVSSKLEGKVQLMLSACEKAAEVDTKDPYAAYEAAEKLAKAYDRVIAASKN